MRYSLPASLCVHAAILLAAVIVLPSPDQYEVEEPLSIPVDIVSIEELSQRQATVKAPDPKPVAKPAQPKIEVKEEPIPQPKPAEEMAKAQLEAQPEPPPPPVAETPPPDSRELERLITQSEAAKPVEEKMQAETLVVKPRPRPRLPEKKKQKQLDVEKVAALLNKINEDQTSPPEQLQEAGTPQQGSFDVASGRDARMSVDELDWLRQKIRECWNPPVGVTEAENLQVHVQIELDRSGSVSGVPQVVNRQPHPLFDVAASAAVRAVLRCQPYDRLPPEKFESWHSIILNFDPREMFAG
jgi:hypothetical protein